MWKWYELVEVCYVYLSDVYAEDSLTQSLSKSEWFKRGWTLQEVIASYDVCFVDKSWSTVLGERCSLCDLLSEMTGITESALRTNMRRLYG
jgi:hypothetical protein